MLLRREAPSCTLVGNDARVLSDGSICGAKSWVPVALVALSLVVVGVRRSRESSLRILASGVSAVTSATFDGGDQRVVLEAAAEPLRRQGCLDGVRTGESVLLVS